MIEIAFFPRDGNYYLLLSANQFKSVTPPGTLNPEQGFVFLGSKYIILLNDGFSEIDKFINFDILNPTIPEILNAGEKKEPMMYTYKIFRVERNNLVEVEFTKL